MCHVKKSLNILLLHADICTMQIFQNRSSQISIFKIFVAESRYLQPGGDVF